MQLAHSNFFLFRIPLLSLKKFLLTNQAKTEQQLIENIKILITENPQILTALRISSEQIGLITESWIKNNTELSQKQLYTIYKYIARMATRPTPFGLSAGIGIGYISSKPTVIKIRNKNKIYSRLAISYIGSICNSSNVKLRCSSEQLRLNSMAFEHAGYYRYAKKNENGTSIDRVKVKKNPLLEIVVDQINEGTTYSKLLKSITQVGLRKKDAVIFLEQLIRMQFIAIFTEPALTGNSFRKILQSTLKKDKLNPVFSSLQERLDYDHKKMIGYWETISKKSGENLIPELEVNLQFQTRQANLNENTINIISQELMELHKFFESTALPELESFKKKFLSRYDLREIPILEVMDSDLSIGYGNADDQYNTANPLLQSLSFNKTDNHQNITLKNFIDLQNIQDHKSVELIIPGALLNLRNQEEPDIPPTSFAMGQLIAFDPQNVNLGNFLFALKTWSGPSAVNLMTRFAHMDDELEKELKKLTIFEQELLNDFVLAEVVYSPTSREANILQRPSLHPYELIVLGNSMAAKNFRLSLQDLTISVRYDKIYLRSKSLNKYIIPRLSSAHNYKRANPIYRFLGDVQRHYHPLQFIWDWGDLQETNFLPRVTYKHLLLSRARWFIGFKEDREYNEQLVIELQAKLQIDPIVLIAEADNELYIDLKSPWGRKLLLDSMKKGDVILYEFINTATNFIRNAVGDEFVNELIVPFRFRKATLAVPQNDQISTLIRSFPPGTEWTFLKIYCAPSEANEILLNKLTQVITALMTKHIVQQWFFVRYFDPDFHIRLRMYHPQNNNAHAKIVFAFSEVLQELIHYNQVWKVQYDTYERELERYCPENIELIESLFCSSSETVLAILKIAPNYGDNFIWQMALKSVDALFLAFNLPLAERVALLDNWAKDFIAEFDLSTKDQKQIKLNFRHSKKELGTFLKITDKNVHDIFCHQIEITKKILNTAPMHRRKELRTKLNSIIHMHLNRTFHTEQRANEMVIYIYLRELYRSALAREKFN